MFNKVVVEIISVLGTIPQISTKQVEDADLPALADSLDKMELNPPSLPVIPLAPMYVKPHVNVGLLAAFS